MNNVLFLSFLIFAQSFIVQASASPSRGNAFPTNEEFVQEVLSGEIFSQEEKAEMQKYIEEQESSKSTEDSVQEKQKIFKVL